MPRAGEQVAALTSMASSLISQLSPGLFMCPGRGWAQRLISPTQALPLLTGPGDVELRVQGSALSLGPDK